MGNAKQECRAPEEPIPLSAGMAGIQAVIRRLKADGVACRSRKERWAEVMAFARSFCTDIQPHQLVDELEKYELILACDKECKACCKDADEWCRFNRRQWGFRETSVFGGRTYDMPVYIAWFSRCWKSTDSKKIVPFKRGFGK